MAVHKASGVSMGADRWDRSRERLDDALRSVSRRRLFTVHRLDRETSGVVLFAKDAETHRRLSLAFERRTVKKRYLAVIHGSPAWKETACALPLVPDGDKRHRTIIDKYQGKKALTRFRFQGGAGNYTLVEALPESGRTHQIRAHLAALGHPVVCDRLYGTEKPVYLSSFKRTWRGDPLEERPLLARLGLHAADLTLPYPQGGGELSLHAPLPKDMASLINQMRKNGPSPTVS
ncbi:MAG: RNA pseudouridine synthase [Spirochaetaceae bacterium]|nr:RNA pseudouridine synthase [Spirochaetaceae bacterium]